MDSEIKGREHGEAVRKAAEFAKALAVAVAKDVALNARRGRGYLTGFLQGIAQRQTTVPNA
jgi:hypothetical protein